MREFYIKTKRKECFPFDEKITKLEMRAFGWKYKGIQTDYYDTYDVYIDWDKGEASAHQRFKVYNTFKRITPYSYNLLFRLLEGLMALFSWIRRKMIFLLFGITALLLIFGTLETLSTKEMSDGLIWGSFFLFFTYVPSLVLIVLGFVVRKVLRIDAKLEDRLDQNGYERKQRF